MPRPRTLIVSEFNAGDRAHFALAHEFCRLVAEIDDADIVAPGIDNYLDRYFGRFLPDHDGHNVQRDFNRLVNGMRKGLRLRNRPTIAPAEIDKTYDLFFFVGWSPQSLVELARIKRWRSRCKYAVAYLFELWSTTLERDKAYLRLLDQFDRVFLLHSAAIPRLHHYTCAFCSALPTGVDCLIATPYPSPPERVLDVYSIGNRSASLHRQLVSLAQSRGLFYVYDSLSSTDSRVKDWREHRLLLASMIKRARYFIAFSPASLAIPKAQKVDGEQVLPSRLFEGAAGGAVLLGTAPRCAEFDVCFDWPDAVIEISPEEKDIGAVIGSLDAQPERIARVRHANVVSCLLRHDWVYRWEHILCAIGLDPLPPLQERKAGLCEIAAAAPLPEHQSVPAAGSPVPGASRASQCANPAYSRRADAVIANQ